MFRNFYVIEDGKEFDAVENGELSCAFYVSSILKLFDFISEIHGTVDGVEKDLVESGWQKVEEPRIGGVIIWEKKDFGAGDIHKHIGFYIGNNRAISTSPEKGYPIGHDLNAVDRNIESIYWNDELIK